MGLNTVIHGSVLEFVLLCIEWLSMQPICVPYTVSVFKYFCPKLSKSVQYDLWLFQLFLYFSIAYLYQELSGYVSQISLVLHMYPQ